jgi:hypothetical protein
MDVGDRVPSIAVAMRGKERDGARRRHGHPHARRQALDPLVIRKPSHICPKQVVPGS